jgi:hypothetical protein
MSWTGFNWTDQHPRFVADITGDCWADIVGFGGDGCVCRLSNGDGSFTTAADIAEFGVDQGWRVDQHSRFLPDVTGDGRRRAGRRHRDPGYAADCRPGLGQVKHATARQHNIAVAEEAGYGRFVGFNGVACIDMPGVGAMGVHHVNGTLVGDDKVDALTYPAAYQARLPRSPTGVRMVIDTRAQVVGRG